MRFTRLVFKKSCFFKKLYYNDCVSVWIFTLQVLAVIYALYIPSSLAYYIKALYVEKLGMMQKMLAVSPLLSDLFGKSISDAPIMPFHFGDVMFLIIYSIPLLFWLCLVHINRALCYIDTMYSSDLCCFKLASLV